MDRKRLDELRAVYGDIRDRIEARLSEFEEVWKRGNDEKLFFELVFCLLTPGARARNADLCLRKIEKKKLLKDGDIEDLSACLNLVRFKNNKARNIVEARRKFLKKGGVSIREALERMENGFERREYLVSEVRGMGYKEASHFLRNIGLGDGLAILDRHVLKYLESVALIDSIPQSLPKKRYLEMERILNGLAVQAGMRVTDLDFVLWFMATGDVFK
ncbi:MAG: N-glycosylase/DNA lyase [Spirochaetes bacterium]|nr:N-glycosylase/DNA lyase [Spirochaetota bacterium]